MSSDPPQPSLIPNEVSHLASVSSLTPTMQVLPSLSSFSSTTTTSSTIDTNTNTSTTNRKKRWDNPVDITTLPTSSSSTTSAPPVINHTPTASIPISSSSTTTSNNTTSVTNTTTTAKPNPNAAWPSSLEQWANRVMTIAQKNPDISKQIIRELQEIVKNATSNGTLWTNNWDNEPIVPTALIRTQVQERIRQQQQQQQQHIQPPIQPSTQNILPPQPPVPPSSYPPYSTSYPYSYSTYNPYTSLPPPTTIPSSSSSSTTIDPYAIYSQQQNMYVQYSQLYNPYYQHTNYYQHQPQYIPPSTVASSTSSTPNRSSTDKQVIRTGGNNIPIKESNTSVNEEKETNEPKVSFVWHRHSEYSDDNSESEGKSSKKKKKKKKHDKEVNQTQKERIKVGPSSASMAGYYGNTVIEPQYAVPSTVFSGGISEDGEILDWSSTKPIIGTCTILEKRYFRLVAAPDPSTVRPVHILEQALDLILERYREGAKYLYICDQLKSIRQDLTLQHIKTDFTVKVYETHARIALEFSDPSEFNQCQTQLDPLYKYFLNNKQNNNTSSSSENNNNTSTNNPLQNRLEFIAYRILYSLYTNEPTDAPIILHKLNTEERNHPWIKNAMAVVIAWTTANYGKFFQLYTIIPNLGSYIIDWITHNTRIQTLLTLSKR